MPENKTPTDDGLPRVYRVDERTRHAVNFSIVAVGSLILAITVLTSTGMLPYRGSPHGLFVLDSIMAGILVMIGSFYNKRAILYRDSIEVRGWFYSRKLKFVEIRGRQTSADSRLPYGYAYILVSSVEGQRKLVLPHYLHTDQFFRDWIRAIPKIQS